MDWKMWFFPKTYSWFFGEDPVLTDWLLVEHAILDT